MCPYACPHFRPIWYPECVSVTTYYATRSRTRHLTVSVVLYEHTCMACLCFLSAYFTEHIGVIAVAYNKLLQLSHPLIVDTLQQLPSCLHGANLHLVSWPGANLPLSSWHPINLPLQVRPMKISTFHICTFKIGPLKVCRFEIEPP